LYLAIEMQSLCLYVLAASKKNSSFSTEAGLKYFLLGSFSSALLLFGMSILYGCTGTTNFENFTLLLSGVDLDNFSTTSSISNALLFVGAAFFFKIAAAPFHMWSPDVYEGSPTSSTIFFAVIPKIALFAVFIRMFQTVFSSFEDTLLIMSIFFFDLFCNSRFICGFKTKKVEETSCIQFCESCRLLIISFFCEFN